MSKQLGNTSSYTLEHPADNLLRLGVPERRCRTARVDSAAAQGSGQLTGELEAESADEVGGERPLEGGNQVGCVEAGFRDQVEEKRA